MIYRLYKVGMGLYRELFSSDIIRLPPIQRAFYLLGSFVPLLHCHLRGNGENIDDVHSIM